MVVSIPTQQEVRRCAATLSTLSALLDPVTMLRKLASPIVLYQWCLLGGQNSSSLLLPTSSRRTPLHSAH